MKKKLYIAPQVKKVELSIKKEVMVTGCFSSTGTTPIGDPLCASSLVCYNP